MTVTITNSMSVRQRAVELGCNIPEKLTILPSNFEEAPSQADFLQPSEAATVRALFRQNSIGIEDLASSQKRPAYIQNNSYEWVSPVIFLGSSLLLENQDITSVALSVIATYVTDFFKGTPGEKVAKLDFVVERKRDYSCARVHYEGSIDGIAKLSEVIVRICNE